MIHQKSTVDWLRTRTQAEPREVLEALRPMFGSLGPDLAFKTALRPVLGFRQAAQVMAADVAVGRLDWGGESMRGWVRVDVSGSACQWVQDWDAVAELEALPSAELTRLDLAVTTWSNEVGHDRVVDAHQAGRFVCGGRPPAMRQIISTDPRAGRTCEVGRREKADKFFRGYEKGFELAGKLPGELGAGLTHIDGFPVEGIYRCEVEFKAVNKSLPWEVVERRDHYFAGAYPFCADILPGVDADILQRRPDRKPVTDLAAALENVRIQYGATLFTALHAYHGDMSAVWDRIVGQQHNIGLVEAGVLMVDHDADA